MKTVDINSRSLSGRATRRSPYVRSVANTVSVSSFPASGSVRAGVAVPAAVAAGEQYKKLHGMEQAGPKGPLFYKEFYSGYEKVNAKNREEPPKNQCYYLINPIRYELFAFH